MAGVVHVEWYATVLRQESFADAVAEVARLSLRYGARRYAVHRARDDRYRVRQMLWFENPDDWYRYWESPELIEFRARNAGRFQIPINYAWHDELAAGELGPYVEAANGAPERAPQPEPHASA
jgi:hypothetical protein